MTMTFRQVYRIFVAVLFISLVGSSWQNEMTDNAMGSPMSSPMPQQMLPLAVISDEPMSLAKSIAKVPLVPVLQKDLVVVKNADISAISPDNALIPYFNKRTGVTEAMPAVKMFLRSPVLINPRQPRSVVDFPSFINVAHRGSLVPLPVGALIAPINYQHFSQPYLVRMVYAVPNFPINYQFGASMSSAPAPAPYMQPYFYQPYSLPYTFYNQQPHYNLPSTFYNYRPIGAFPAPAADPRPLPAKQPAPVEPAQPGVAPTTIKQPTSQYSGPQALTPTGQPVVTVLDFPEAVASPSVLYYQPPIGPDTEFENREPPQPVIPAGIIQSTAPQPNQQLFMNSKESVYLVSIKEDLKKL